MAQLPEIERKKKRKQTSAAANEDATEQEQTEEQSPSPKKKTRRQIVNDTILERFHRSQELQSTLKTKRQPDDIDTSEQQVGEEGDVTEEEQQPPAETVKLTAEEQHQADQVLDDVNKLRKEKKKKLAKEKKKFKKEQQKLLKQQAEEQKESKQDKALAYLKLWKKQRDDWKFKKINHIWLLKNWKHSTKIPDKRFKTFLKYLKSTEQKSLALKRLEEEAKTIVDSAETTAPIAGEDANHSYDRARNILQWII